MPKLKLTIRNIDETITTLEYSLFNNPVVDRWKIMTEMSIEKGYKITSRFTNKDINNIDYLINKINGVINIINEHYDKVLPVFTDTKSVDVPLLNYLHMEFEIWGDRTGDIKTLAPKILHENFLKLNEWIHIIESALHNDKSHFPNYTSLYDFLPAGLHEPMTEIDKLFLETKYKWGGLYCGYNTLGKDWFAISIDNDVDVLIRNQVRPQRRFAAETWLNFGADISVDIKNQFFDWYSKLSEENKNKVPINNLNEMTLGRLLLGQIIINQTFLNFHPIFSDWETPNHECKIRWNREVFSKADELINVEIIK